MHQPVDAARLFCNAVSLVIKDGDKFRADALALDFRLGDAGKFLKEAGTGVDGHNVEAELAAQVALDALKLVFAQHAVIYKNAGELVADGLVHQHRSHRRIDAAGEPADYVPAAHLLANLGHGTLDKVGGGPVSARAANVEHKVFDQLRSERRVVHFGMELHGPDALFLVGNAGQRVRRDGGAMEA